MATNSTKVVTTKQKKDNGEPTSIGLGISTLKPKFAQYALVSKRMDSFTDASTPWPEHSPVTVEDLVAAGLVYTGVGDSVRCYHCGGGLRNWEDGDDPMEEHARWYPTCHHVLISKGKRYIQRVEAGESPDSDPIKQPVRQPKDPYEKDRIVFQALLECGYSEPDTKMAIQIFRKRNGCGKKFCAKDIAEILMDMEEKPENFVSLDLTDEPTAVEESRYSQQDCEDEGDDIAALEEENRRLKDSRVCKICLDKTADVIFLPCGHIVSCPLCAPAMGKCPICRKTVMGLVKAYYASKTEMLEDHCSEQGL